MNLFERFSAAWAVLVGTDLVAKEGKPELTEENVASLEASATEIKELRAANTTLKDEASTAAQSISDLEAKVTEAEANAATANAVTEKITAALKENNVEVAEDADVAKLAVEKINAWGKSGGAPTPAVATKGDVLGEYGKQDPTLTAMDIKARERYARRNS